MLSASTQTQGEGNMFSQQTSWLHTLNYICQTLKNSLGLDIQICGIY